LQALVVLKAGNNAVVHGAVDSIVLFHFQGEALLVDLLPVHLLECHDQVIVCFLLAALERRANIMMDVNQSTALVALEESEEVDNQAAADQGLGLYTWMTLTILQIVIVKDLAEPDQH
jgi:hypothetical protein